MLVITDAYHVTDLPSGCSATIGNFDGIHRGQRAIIERTVAHAATAGTTSVMVTFDPHPLAVVRPGESPPRLATPDQKEALVREAGVDAMLIVRFDAEMAARSAEAFVTELLVDRLDTKALFVGSRFQFGRSRDGDVALLRALGERYGFTAEGVEEVLWQGEPVSSTRIRRAIGDGDVTAAMEMLGRPYELLGTVARGDRMGQRLGWPTVNLTAENDLLPRDGVYATRSEFQTYASAFDSVTNVGTRPTVYENYQRVVESHVLDFDSDVYGQAVRLRFYKRLREEMIFPTIMDLSAQIGRDVEATREYFAGRRRLEALEAGA